MAVTIQSTYLRMKSLHERSYFYSELAESHAGALEQHQLYGYQLCTTNETAKDIMSHRERCSTVVSNLVRDRISKLRSPDEIASRITPEVSEGLNEILQEKPGQDLSVDHWT